MSKSGFRSIGDVLRAHRSRQGQGGNPAVADVFGSGGDRIAGQVVGPAYEEGGRTPFIVGVDGDGGKLGGLLPENRSKGAGG